MAIPDFQSLMLPVLRMADRAGEVRIGSVVIQLADEYNLSVEDREQMLPSNRQATFANRVHWAKSYLNMAGLVRNTRRGYFEITAAGRGVLRNSPERIDIKYLDQFPGFTEKRAGKSGNTGASGNAQSVTRPKIIDITVSPIALPPDEQLRAASAELDQNLGAELIDRAQSAPPDFFEHLVVRLLTAMGYGGAIENAGRTLGKSGDGGVDGVIDKDALGLERIYVQAKRYSDDATVGAGAIRDFFGALNLVKANKGVFITTSSYTSEAKSAAQGFSTRIVLIDGEQLAKLMIRYGVGCRVEETFAIKRIDEDFFEME